MRRDTQEKFGHLACVFGVSGVGKSFLISQFRAANLSWAALRASDILTAITKQSADELRKQDPLGIEQNQYKLVEAIHRIRKTTKLNFLLDGHCVIDNEQVLVAIPPDVIFALDPGLIVFVYDSPELILSRVASDKKRARTLRSTSQIRSEQDFAAQTCEQYSQALGIQYGKVRSGDVSQFANLVEIAFPK